MLVDFYVRLSIVSTSVNAVRDSAVAPWTAETLRVLEERAEEPAVFGTEPSGGGRWSGGEFRDRAAGAADLLAELGERGQPVPGLLSARSTALALTLGGACVGRPIAPLPPRHTVDELAAMVGRMPGHALLAEPDHAETGEEVAAATGRRLQVVDVVPLGSGSALRLATADPVLVLHTSGTTGMPKRVDVTDAGLGHRTRVSGATLRLGPGAVYAGASPFHHIGGVGNAVVALARGAAVASFPRFSVAAWPTLRELGATHVLVVPTMIEMLLRGGGLALPTLRTLIYGGSPIHPETLRAAMAALPGVDFVNIFGQTEGSPLTSLTPDDHRAAAGGREDLLRSIGRPLPGVVHRIVDPDDEGFGELHARAPHLSTTAAAGWLRTGDIVRADDDGYLFLAGRRHDLIIRGGENIHPVEVEQVLVAHPDVEAAAVIGVPDPLWGQTVAAFVVPRPGATPTVEELRAAARDRLARHKLPTVWRFVDALPVSPNGKLLRDELRIRLSDG